MIRQTCFFALIAVGLAICNPAQGQTMSFFRQYSAPVTDVHSTAVTADRSGIYVFGNAGVGKYDSRGNELWNRAFSAPANVRAAAVDASGVYGLGLSGIGDQSFLRKYSSEGSGLWTRQLERSAAGLAADSTGVYVGGGDFSASSTLSYLRKFSPDGGELWTRRFDGSLGGVVGVAVDATGVYVLSRHGDAGPPVRTVRA